MWLPNGNISGGTLSTPQACLFEEMQSSTAWQDLVIDHLLLSSTEFSPAKLLVSTRSMITFAACIEDWIQNKSLHHHLLEALWRFRSSFGSQELNAVFISVHVEWNRWREVGSSRQLTSTQFCLISFAMHLKTLRGFAFEAQSGWLRTVERFCSYDLLHIFMRYYFWSLAFRWSAA